MAEEDAAALWAALGALPATSQRLLRMLIVDPRHSYAQIAATLDMSVGSIGPVRARSLRHLRNKLVSTETRQDAPRTPADQNIGSLFAAAEMAWRSHEPAHDEAAALKQFNTWLDGNTITGGHTQRSALRPRWNPGSRPMSRGNENTDQAPHRSRRSG